MSQYSPAARVPSAFFRRYGMCPRFNRNSTSNIQLGYEEGILSMLPYRVLHVPPDVAEEVVVHDDQGTDDRGEEPDKEP